jgi:hypothetical protein
MGRKWSDIQKDLPMRMKLRGTGALPGVLAEGEICPGLSYEDHAESLAMFEARDLPASNKTWETFVSFWTEDNLNALTSDMATGQPIEDDTH